ncbi:hypothetical protein [Candidatus Endomicrobiellum agilis]|uniref:hypothetical protein n=1 Tax=Candidatus Endomicrobiellum agilis TaxID=3238957 RepID=UPI00357E36DB|nr:hypothetical protein [Endomicrobium sp.]
MKKLICICSSFGCNRTADNVSTAPQSLNASAPVPSNILLSPSPNAPQSTTLQDNCPPC